MIDGIGNVARITHVRCNALEAFCIRIVDQASMSGGRKENPVLLPFDVAGLQQVVQLGAELARVVFPYFHVVFGELVVGLGHPVRFVGPRSRDKVYLEAGFAKDLEGIKHFADEQSCLGHNASMLERGFVKAKCLFRNDLPVSLQ